MAENKDDKPEEPHVKPRSVSDVLPTSLQVAGWTIPIVIGLVGAVKTVTDMTIAAQQEIRARANAEIAFFDKQYDYAAKMAGDERAQGLLKASVNALLARRQPDFQVNGLFDWALQKQRDQALFLVCAARKTAFDTYDSGAVATASVYFRTRFNRFQELGARSKAGSAAALLVAYESACKLALASPEEAAAAGLAASAATPAPKPAAQAPVQTAAAPPPSPPGPPPIRITRPTATGYSASTSYSAEVYREIPALDCAVPPNLPATTTSAPTAQTHAGAIGGWDLDIFWCAHADLAQAKANYTSACRAYGTLISQSQVGGESIGRVRLRRLPTALQGKGYPTTGTVVRYDVGEASEQLLSDEIGRTVWPGRYKLQPSNSGTRWYVSMFSCGPN